MRVFFLCLCVLYASVMNSSAAELPHRDPQTGAHFAMREAGATVQAKLATCLAHVHAEGGGECDASGIIDSYAISTNIFAGVTNPVYLRGSSAAAVAITVNLTLPANVTFRPNGIWSPSDTTCGGGKCTLTIDGGIDNPGNVQIFGNTGYVKTPNTTVLYAEWWGAKADNSTPSQAAFVSAIAALPTAGGSIIGSQGTYLITGLVIQKPVSFRGAGSGKIGSPEFGSTVLKTTSNQAVLDFDTIDASNSEVRDLVILGNSTGTSQHGVVVECRYFLMNNVQIGHMGGHGVYLADSISSYYSHVTVSGVGRDAWHIEDSPAGSGLTNNNYFVGIQGLDAVGNGFKTVNNGTPSTNGGQTIFGGDFEQNVLFGVDLGSDINHLYSIWSEGNGTWGDPTGGSLHFAAGTQANQVEFVQFGPGNENQPLNNGNASNIWSGANHIDHHSIHRLPDTLFMTNELYRSDSSTFIHLLLDATKTNKYHSDLHQFRSLGDAAQMSISTAEIDHYLPVNNSAVETTTVAVPGPHHAFIPSTNVVSQQTSGQRFYATTNPGAFPNRYSEIGGYNDGGSDLNGVVVRVGYQDALYDSFHFPWDGTLKSDGRTLAFVEAATAGKTVWCLDCAVGTTPCADSGNGAWASAYSTGVGTYAWTCGLGPHNHAASDITSGTVALARGGTAADLSATGAATYFLAQDASHVISARAIASGDLPALRGGVLSAYCGGGFPGGSTVYLPGYGGGSSVAYCTLTSESGGMPATSAGTAKNLRVNVATAGCCAGSGIVTLRINGSPTALTCTVGTGTTCADTSHTANMAAGDVLTISVATGSPETLATMGVAFEIWY